MAVDINALWILSAFLAHLLVKMYENYTKINSLRDCYMSIYYRYLAEFMVPALSLVLLSAEKLIVGSFVDFFLLSWLL